MFKEFKESRFLFAQVLLTLVLTIFLLSCSRNSHTDSETSLATQSSESVQEPSPSPPRSVKGLMQAHPGGPMEEVEVAVHQVPVDVPSVDANQASLDDDDLVLGVQIDEQAMAYPIRYLAMYEIVDDRVGDTPLAPTW